MRVAVLVLAGTLPLFAGCAMKPAWVQPVIAEDGAFAGPVVATRGGYPLAARYEDACETGRGRWVAGGWRSYGPRPCVESETVVRARY